MKIVDLITENRWRALKPVEAAIFERMLKAEFTGVEQLREQFKTLLVENKECCEFCLYLKTSGENKATVKTSPPVEASYCDTGEIYSDGPNQPGTVPCSILLHVNDGLMVRLEVYKVDGSDVLRYPSPEEMHIFTPYHWDNE